MAIVLEEFVSKLLYDVDTKEIDKFKDSAKDSLQTFAKLGAAVTAALGALSYGMLKVSKGIVEIENTSRALGVSYKFWDALSDNLEITGFSANELGKSIGYMSRNLGELKRGGEGAKIFQEALTDMNITLGDFEGKSVEEQFLFLTDSIKELAGEDVEKAFSVTKDFLQMRGISGNKLVRFLKESDLTLSQIVERTGKIDFMDQDAVEGAYAFVDQWNDLTLTLIDSIQQRVSGLVGGALAPMLEAFLAWVALNRELVETKIQEWVEGIVKALKWFFSVAKNIYVIVSRVIDVFGGFENVLKLVGIGIMAVPIAKMLLAFSQIQKLALFKSALAALLNPVGIIALLLGVIVLVIDELYTYFKGGETVLGSFGEKLGDLVHDHIDPFMAALFGMDVDQWRFMVAKNFDMTVEAVKGALDFIIGYFKWFYNGAKEVLNNLYTDVKNIVNGITDLFGSKLSNAIKTKVDVTGAGLKVQRSGGAQVSPSSNITNSSNQTSKKTDVKNYFNIKQSPGESGEALANKVTKNIEQSVNRAVLANGTGVEY